MSSALTVIQGSDKKTDRPMFTAERKMLATRKSEPGFGVQGANVSVDNSQVLAAIAAMQAEIHALRHEVSALSKGETIDQVVDPVTMDEATNASMKAHQENVSQLKTELRALSVCIAQTKAEIASIHPAASGDDHLMVVSNELDAVVASTEQATTEILDAVEWVETEVRNIKAHVSDTYVSSLADDILDKLIKVMEACNFQDLTGQRITKVVNTLKFVEERVTAMIKIWGEEGVIEAAEEAVRFGGHRPDTEDNHLLNGPQLDGEGINQADIDALFD